MSIPALLLQVQVILFPLYFCSIGQKAGEELLADPTESFVCKDSGFVFLRGRFFLINLFEVLSCIVLYEVFCCRCPWPVDHGVTFLRCSL